MEQPLNTSKIEPSADLLELTELLAHNIHDIWARQRLAEGWKYGERRNDERKEHPCLIPYEDLPENEKEYDRNTAMETIRFLLSQGYEIIRK
jgi:hypothetical protein